MTSTSKHTPGPWVVRGPSCVEGQGPFERVARYWAGAGYQIIADCSHKATSGTDCEANARLIAVAPDLLAELSACATELEKVLASDGMINQNRYVIFARAVIANATGEA